MARDPFDHGWGLFTGSKNTFLGGFHVSWSQTVVYKGNQERVPTCTAVTGLCMAAYRLPGTVQRLYTYMHQKLHMSELAIVGSFLCLPILMGAPPAHGFLCSLWNARLQRICDHANIILERKMPWIPAH